MGHCHPTDRRLPRKNEASTAACAHPTRCRTLTAPRTIDGCRLLQYGFVKMMPPTLPDDLPCFEVGTAAYDRLIIPIDKRYQVN
jgi:hypothetical protein